MPAAGELPRGELAPREQADPGAYGQGEDLASTADDPSVTGEEELTTGRDAADDAGGGDLTGGGVDGPGVVGGAFSEAPVD
ncbi:hypothetical protein DQ238_06280 [Geodermatophilus sp. TF02-6]|nr:hypothetical protein DQ238_06280 [Geodermatophilus sp. TF02-6]